MNLRFELLYFDSGETPTAVQVQLSADKSFLIGSGESCDLRLQMGGVLSMHCLLEVNAKGGVDVVSVDDTSPVIVNGESALQSPVEDGDRIELGQAALVLRAAPPQPVAAATGSHGSSHGSHGSGSRGSGSHGSGSHGSGSHGSHGAHGGNSSSGLRQALQSAESRAEPVDPLVEETFAELQTTYPEHAARRPAQQQLQLLQRGLTTARSNGFDTPELIKRFLHCVLLLDNDLSKATNSDIAYVLDTLTVPSKSREKRLDRAISLSRRIADQNKDAYKGGAKPVTPKPLDPQSPESLSPPPSPLLRSPLPPSPLPQSPPRVPDHDISVSMPVFPAQSYPHQDLPPPPPSTYSPPKPIAPTSASPPQTPAVRSPEIPAASSEAPAQPVPPAPAKAAVSVASVFQAARSTVSRRPNTTAGPSTTAGPEQEELDEHGFPQIDGFRIIEQVASGGMGTVYRAHDLQLDIDVAIKVLRSLHPSAQQQFLLEARAAAKLQHPNIVPVLRYEQYGQGGYCVMQLIKGTDAHRLIRRFSENASTELGAERILEIANLSAASITPELRALIRVREPYYKFVAYWLAGVAEGLDRAHAEGIIHYDVKPNNMMLASDGRLMLGDFGLATLAGRQGASSKSSCIGTPGYLSPEMLASWACRSGMVETDSRVDIWGLGTTMYEFLTFKPAYTGSLAKVLRAIATSDPPKPCDVMWPTPPELQRICLKAMARNPDERYLRASEMADELRTFLSAIAKTPSRATRPSGPLSWLKRPQSGE